MGSRYNSVIKKIAFLFFILAFGMSHVACTNVDPEFDIFAFNKIPSGDDNAADPSDPNGGGTIGDNTSGGSAGGPAPYCDAARIANGPFANSNEAGIDGLSEANAFTICTPAQLMAMGADELSLQKHYVLKQDLDLVSLGVINPLGHGTGSMFVGQLNGEGHEIRDLYVGTPGVDYVGLFHGIGLSGEVVNVRFKNPNIYGNTSVGVVAGKSSGGQIRQVSAVNAYVNGSYRTGGLVGENSSAALIADSFFDGYVWSDNYQVGGVAGYNGGAEIRRVYVVGQVMSAGGDQVGGVVGYNQFSSGIVSDSWSRADVSGVSSSNKVGPIVGLVAVGATVVNSAFDQSSVYENTGGGAAVNFSHGTGVPQSSYFYSSSSAVFGSWDPAIWFFDEINHPYLR
ncbi:MAG: hypothetical protein H6626_04140 [Pseudobdellovibrionaceae bacterium]|nr:hypothetical protein [Bdellovibrionales bacterium]USN48288.1 MAG: hypothetical protein H6626_04140 [Pseudobdellovibrionaceae bacterium]